MKILKKISLVYALQIFAVILLFGYAVASPVNKTKKKTDDALPVDFNNQPLLIKDKDSVLSANINAFWNHTAKTR